MLAILHLAYQSPQTPLIYNTQVTDHIIVRTTYLLNVMLADSFPTMLLTVTTMV